MDIFEDIDTAKSKRRNTPREIGWINNALILLIYTLKQYVHSTSSRSSASLRSAIHD